MLFFHLDIDSNTRLGAWKIEEEESFFLEQVPLQREITHPNKRLQHLAGRYLLKFLFPEFPVSLIQVADTRKPFLEDETYHFSISHCSNYAAVIVSQVNRVGIDIERIHPKLEKVSHKFLSEEEQFILQSTRLSHLEQLTLAWSCKEAVFKWYGAGEVDFKNHMQVKSTVDLGDNKFRTIVAFKKQEELFLTLENYFFADLCLSYVVT